jgi:serine/threonine-protein kinase
MSLSGTSGVPSSPGSLPGEPKYRPIAELGRGGMATVYLALVRGPADFSKLQVIKRLRPTLAEDPTFLQMFLDEARLAARINHPNVVQTNDVGFDGEYYYIAMEYLEGQTLRAILSAAKRSGTPLSRNLHIRLLCEALAGLHFAHELKDFDGKPLTVVHRDMSPHNVMVTYEGGVKLLDFGIAKAADAREDTRSGVIKGKCAYMSLEQFGGKDVDRRADIFAVGVMLWQAVTGKHLWGNLSDGEILARLVNDEVPSPRSVEPSAPEELDRICQKALANEREDRYATAADLHNELEAYLREAGANDSVRDLGKFVAGLFAEKRQEIATKIEERIRQAASLPSDAAPISSPLPTLSVTPVREKLASTPADRSSSLGELAPRRPWKRMAIPGAVVGALALLGIAIAARDTSDSDAALQAPTDSAGLADTTHVELSIVATPPDAKLYLDGAPLHSNPSNSKHLRDGATHHIRAEAPGHVTSSRVVTFDVGAVSVDIALDPEQPEVEDDTASEPDKPAKVPARSHSRPRPPPPRAEPEAPASAESVAEPPPPPPPPPAQPKQPTLDTSNPWGKPSKPPPLDKDDIWK